MELSEKKLKTRDYVVIASRLFGLFFGAGNLIFPLHLGQLAGANWFPAMLGFLVTAVALPLLGVLAIAATHAEGVYDIGRPLGRLFSLLLSWFWFTLPFRPDVRYTADRNRVLYNRRLADAAKSVGAGWSAGLLGLILCRRLFPILQGTQNRDGLLAKSSIQFSLSCYSSSSLLVCPIRWEIQRRKLSQQLIKMPAS